MTLARPLLCLLLVASTAAAAPMTPQQRAGRIEALRRSAPDAFAKKNYGQAAALYKELLSLDPNDRNAARYLGFAQQLSVESFCKQAAMAYARGNYRKAIEVWETIAKINPDDTRPARLIEMTRVIMAAKNREAMYADAERYLKERKYSLAVIELEKLLFLQPDDVRVKEMLEGAKRLVRDEAINEHLNAATTHMKEGRFDQAIDEWKKVLAIDGSNEQALRSIAVAHRAKLEAEYVKAKELYESGRYAAARELYTAILEKNPTDLDVKQSMERLTKVIAIAPAADEQGPAWDMLRKSLSHHISPHGNLKAAIVAVRYADQLAPDTPLIASFRDYLEREHISIVRSLEPYARSTNIIDQYLTVALNHIYEGRFDLAAQDCEVILILQPNNVLALKRLGSSFYAMGKGEKAEEAWRQALKLAPDDGEIRQFLKQAR